MAFRRCALSTQSIAAVLAASKQRQRLAENPEIPAAARRAALQYGSGCSPDCEICGGVGWLRRDLPITDPGFGKMTRCPNSKVNQDFSRCGLDELDRALTWEAVEDKNNALQVAASVRAALMIGKGWVFLWGTPGLAKSLLLKIAVAEALRLGREAAFVEAADLINHIKGAFDVASPSREAEARLDYWSSLPVLAIDELDKISETPWVRQVRFSLLNRRYEDGVKGRSFTLIASQLHPDRLPEELASRINDGRFQVIQVRGEDQRPAESWWLNQ
jgi:DNA replication protein DnaC